MATILTQTEQIAKALIELKRSMHLSAEREEYTSASDMKRIIQQLEMETIHSYTDHEIEQLQSEIYKITGAGEVMGLFNKLLGVGAG